MELGKDRIYNDAFENCNNVIMWDIVNIKNKQKLKLCFIEKNSNNRQGVRLGIDVGEGYIEINGIKSKSIELWEDTAPKEIICNCISSMGLLSVYNIWDKGKGRQSQLLTSGMILKEENKKYIYYCNDYGFKTNFDKLVFSLEGF